MTLDGDLLVSHLHKAIQHYRVDRGAKDIAVTG